MQRRPSEACLWLFGCAALAIALSPLGASAQNAKPIRIGVIGEESSSARSRPPARFQAESSKCSPSAAP